MTVSNFQEHSSPLFKLLKIIELKRSSNTSYPNFYALMPNQLLSASFDTFFTPVTQIHSYNLIISHLLELSMGNLLISDFKDQKYGMS